MTERHVDAPKQPAPAGKPGEPGTATGTGKAAEGAKPAPVPAQGGQKG